MGKRESNKTKNEKKIINSAIKLFTEFGIGETTIDKIVQKSGLARGTFYNYFKSKYEIWDKIIFGLLTSLNENAREERHRAETLHDYIYNAYYAAFEVLTSSPYPALIAKNQSEFRESLYSSNAIRSVFQDLENDLRNSKLFKDVPPYFFKMYTYSMVGAGFELVIQNYLNQDDFSVEKMTSFITALFEKSLIS